MKDVKEEATELLFMAAKQLALQNSLLVSQTRAITFYNADYLGSHLDAVLDTRRKCNKILGFFKIVNDQLWRIIESVDEEEASRIREQRIKEENLTYKEHEKNKWGKNNEPTGKFNRHTRATKSRKNSTGFKFSLTNLLDSD